MDMPRYFTCLLTELNQHWLLERLFFASLEFAALAMIVWAAIHLLRLRQPRLIALLWLLVLAKPLASLAFGGFLPTLAFRPPPPALMPVESSGVIPLKPPVDAAPRHLEFPREIHDTSALDVAKNRPSTTPLTQVHLLCRLGDKRFELARRGLSLQRGPNRLSILRTRHDHLRSDRRTLILERSAVNRMDPNPCDHV